LALDKAQIETIAGDIPCVDLTQDTFGGSINIVDLLVGTGILSSRGEAKKAIQGNGISVNKIKISALEHVVSTSDLLFDQYIMLDNGKKNKYLIRVI
jgi:tyrosyl-tRNA synthetase